MSAMTHPLASIDDALIVDEVGIESGVYGKYRLRSSYQPIFARQGQVLRPVAVEGLVTPYLAGEPVPPADFFAGLPERDWRFIEWMCRALQLRNHCNIGVGDLELYVDCDPPAETVPDALTTEIHFLARELGEGGLEPRLLVCAISEAAALDRAMLLRLAAEMRSHGLRIAIGDFGAGHWTEELTDLLRPDIVGIDGEWFRKICRDATTVRLFETVMSRLREREAKVLVKGIEDQAQFGVALRAGADLFQGSHLAAPALVGTVFNETPLGIVDKLSEASKIVPLFG